MTGRVKVRAFSPELAEHFDRLNRDWLERFFEVEPIDEAVLTEPQQHIIDPGGAIFFALLDGRVVGTGALKAHGDEYEITKMGVEPGHQNAGIGRALVLALIEAWRGKSGRLLFIETSTKLPQAIHLYEKCGFVRQPTPRPGSAYMRSDVYLIFENA
ncbi:MAG: GNAT family N-acetyltransferase [Pseudomonadota bacterium]